MSLTVSFNWQYRQTVLWDLITDGSHSGKWKKPPWKIVPSSAKTSNVMKQIRTVRIELTTKDWKSPILPLNYVRFCSGITCHYSGIERRSITSMPQWTTNVITPLYVWQTKYGREDLNLHGVSSNTSLVYPGYLLQHFRIKGWSPTPTNDRNSKNMNNIHDVKS